MTKPLPQCCAELVFYGGIARDALIGQLLAEATDAAAFYAALSAQAVEKGWRGNIFLCYLADAVACADHTFSRAAAALPLAQLPPLLQRLAEQELAVLQRLARSPLPGAADWQAFAADFPALPSGRYCGEAYEAFLGRLGESLLAAPPEQTLRLLADFHYRFGYGELVRYPFLSWEDGLTGVANADTVQLQQLFAYERQKQQVFENTAAFAAGKPANNLLLYGEKGTGKSSLVKAMVNHFAPTGLRLLYLPRRHWSQLARVLAELAAYRQRFIIFLDDFSFDAADYDYKQIKSVIEGGAAAQPPHVLLYATSNRRHLVAESWQDREQKQEEMYLADTVSEKLALSDRFGLTITFPPPSQDDYLRIVAGIAGLEGLELPEEELFREAVRWERWYHARSGRTARQFINHLLGQQTEA